MESCERDVRSRDLDLDLMEGSALMMPLVKRKDARTVEKELKASAPHLLAVDARISV